ncbi:MAG TPA: nuclease-related domain-containing protein, partial [Gammaproteobacteria bacterium]|nr:nuclease-related domain-containing protein [Gammaproteobacteria bacterium]
VLGFMRWYASRHAARASAALGAVFARLALQGHRVFHAVPLGEEVADHVVIGSRGAFVILVLARRPRKEAKSARLHGRFLEFQDGIGLPAPVLSAERCARALAELSGRNLSHRINVRPVVAVPGWEIAPAESPVSDVLLVNEKNAMMLLGWTKPADALFEEDAAKLQEQLVKLCANPSL